ncbi:MAG: hypothetical protein LKKZDAJK_002705 [Candidatus Fervidibacter sp.]
MWRLKRFLAEREALIGIVIFGVLVMVADILSDLEWHGVAAFLRIVGIAALVALAVLDWIFRFRKVSIVVPLVFTTARDRQSARRLFESFIQSSRLSVKPVEQMTKVRSDDLLIQLDHDPRSSPGAENPERWEKAWRELLREWEEEVDRRLKQELLAGETFCYHIYPHLWMPLAFAMGASVDLRRPIVLYHQQQEKFSRVMELTNPRVLFEEPDSSIAPPEKVPQDFATLPQKERLILHLGITDRHNFPEFAAHPDYANAANAGLVYRKALDPNENWLGYVQWLYREAKPLLGRYREIDICLACPSPVAFALGMAFSRTPKITVCDYQNGKYVPVFSLELIEERLPFD